MLAPSVRRSLFVSALCLAGFGGIALSVMHVPAVSAFDESVAQRLNQEAKASSASVEFQRWVTALGTTPFLMWLSFAVIAVLLVRRQWQLASAWVVTLLLMLLFIQQTKLAFGRPRPKFNGEFAQEDSLSFPSGHAIAAMVVFGMLAYLFTWTTTDRRQRRAAFTLCGVVIVLIGFSRMYLGVHYLSDVIGGYFFGGAWLAFCIAMVEDARRHYRAARASSGQ